MTPTTLITGGAGFIGSHLCDRLVAAGDEVLCLDNFRTGTKDNIRHLLCKPNFELLRHDIWLPIYVEVDRIYNLACPASPVHYQDDPISTTKTAVLGAINMLGLAKRRAETLLFDYHRQSRVDIRVIRIFNTYGPRMHPRDGRVVSNFIMQALTGEPITLYGDGSQTRSFCYVDDLVDGMLAMMRQDTETGPLNLGNPCEFTIRQLAELVLELTGSKNKLVFRPLPQDDPVQRRPDITKARAALSWEPKVALEDGLKDTIGYFKSLLAQ